MRPPERQAAATNSKQEQGLRALTLWQAGAQQAAPLRIQRRRQMRPPERQAAATNSKQEQGLRALTLWQAGAQPFEPALPVLRMNRPAGRFTSSAPANSNSKKPAGRRRYQWQWRTARGGCATANWEHRAT